MIPAIVELVERLEPESYVVVAPVDPAVVIRSADEYVREGGEAEPDLAQADARVITCASGPTTFRSAAIWSTSSSTRSNSSV